MTKQPSYRFVGYDEPWVEMKLGEVFKISSGFTGDSSLHSGSYKLTRIETISDGLINVKKLGYSNVAPDDSYKLGIGEILFSNINSIEHIGKVALYDKDYGLYHGINLLRLQPIDVNGIFSFYELGTIEKRNWARSHANKAVNQASINQTILSSLNLQIPTLPEQEAIGSFFQDIDQLISLQQRKLEVLKEQKKTYLKLLFPAKGQIKPALRFAGFEDEWTSALLGDISELYQPKTISSEELLTEGFPVFGANGYIGYYKDYNHKEDQVTISARGEGTGTPSFVEGPVWITGNSMVVNVEKQANIIKQFLYAFCLSFNFKPFVTGGAQPQLTREVLKKVNIMLPSLSEQEAIGSFFQDLDKAIAKQEEKVNQLKESKQTLLRKMFI